MTARISMIPGKTGAHRAPLQQIGDVFGTTLTPGFGDIHYASSRHAHPPPETGRTVQVRCRMSREAPPIRAAERRQIVATAEGRGFRYRCVMSTVGAKDSLGLFRHSVADFSNDTLPRPSAVATICRRSAAL